MRAPLDLAVKHGDTELSNYEVLMFGEAFISWIGATIRVGHASPGSLLDYTTSTSNLDLGSLIMRDFVAWTSGRVDLVEGCEKRMRQLADNAALDRHLANKVDAILAAATTPEEPNA